jgi:hypothetical protein
MIYRAEKLSRVIFVIAPRPPRGRDHTLDNADRGLPTNTPSAGHCPRAGGGHGATPLNTKHLFLISPELWDQFDLISIAIAPPVCAFGAASLIFRGAMVRAPQQP